MTNSIATKTLKTEQIAKPNNKLDRIYNRASRQLRSPVNSYQLALHTGINHATILRLRHPYTKQGRTLDTATFGTLLCLADYDSRRTVPPLKGKLKRQYFLGLSFIDLDIDPTEYVAMLAVIFQNVTNVTVLAKRLHISRCKLESLKNRKQSIFTQPMSILTKLVDYYYWLVKNDIVATEQELRPKE